MSKMKKIISFLIITSVLLSSILVTADETDTAQVVDYKIVYNEELFNFKYQNGKRLFPILFNDSLFLTCHAIEGLFGISVYKNDSYINIDCTPALQVNIFNQQELLKSALPISVTLDKMINVSFNNKIIEFKDVNNNTLYPLYYNGEIFLPIRGIAQYLNLPISFDKETDTVYIYNK